MVDLRPILTYQDVIGERRIVSLKARELEASVEGFGGFGKDFDITAEGFVSSRRLRR